ncbi:MAG: hypothetical protein RLZZ488_147 [Pseudomonadota bacterium]
MCNFRNTLLSMLMNLLKNSEWSFLLDFVSPAFFKVIPPFELIGNATALAKRTRDPELYRSALGGMQSHFARSLPDTRIIAGGMTQAGELPAGVVTDFKTADEMIRVEMATRIVEIYFAQILAKQTLLLDVRLTRFARDGQNILWSPAPLLGVFSDDFLNAMGELYTGYYCGRPEQMKSALKKINLDWAHEVFISHFGDGNQTAVRFTMAHFVHTFHEIFMLCKSERKNLKGEFVQLGVLLGLMYESLESLNVAVDVRSAFHRVLKSRDIG